MPFTKIDMTPQEMPFLPLRVGTLVVHKDQPFFRSPSLKRENDTFPALVLMAVDPVVMVDIDSQHIFYDMFTQEEIVGICDVSQHNLHQATQIFVFKLDFIRHPMKLEVIFGLPRRYLSNEALALIRNGVDYTDKMPEFLKRY
jgi:hypothetical protein